VAGSAGRCNGQGKCEAGASGPITLLEPEDKYLPQDLQELFSELAVQTPGQLSNLMDLSNDLNALRFSEGCPYYPPGTNRYTMCQAALTNYFDSNDDLQADMESDVPPFCSDGGQCDVSGCHKQAQCQAYPVPSFPTQVGELHDTTGMTAEDWEEAVALTRTGLSVAVGFIPVVGDLVDLGNAITGIDLITGEQLDPVDRLMSLAGLIPFVPGKGLRAAKKLASTVSVAENGEYLMLNNTVSAVMTGATDIEAAAAFKNLLRSAKRHGTAALRMDADAAAGKTVGKKMYKLRSLSRGDVQIMYQFGVTMEHGADRVVKLQRKHFKLQNGEHVDLWDLKAFERGFAFELICIPKGKHLGRTFKTFDSFGDGKLVSLKTLNTASTTYQDARKMQALLRRYVKKMATFEDDVLKNGGIKYADSAGFTTEIRKNGDVLRILKSGEEQLLTNYKKAGQATKELHIVIPAREMTQAQVDVLNTGIHAYAAELSAQLGQKLLVTVTALN
jgi:hypothetical protein